ncbi:CpsD/CapB family tyrosine-protein kinase [uncultured Dysosmobacter sp.]|uniref:CpsD/CapB family tyrosine-protein kinase n=1 Tax=uncultured Dysosmobacter sp. TaxID=2591384 RepID=UPI0026089B8C|nr:CpsD/CapB family tyrosine-protein kinase [uncultured Dysosmobacter sp.]
MQTVNIRANRMPYQVQEAFKTLRSNVEFSGNDMRAICVTSALPNDGKSTVSFELACAFAESGRSTLLIDADLRKSVMRRNIAGGVEFGLTHFLIGKAQFDEAVCETNVRGLHILFAGQFPPNPSELLGSKRFQSLVAQARKAYDVVIIDTPPVGSVIDAAVVSRTCDGVVLVLRDRTISYRLAQQIQTQLNQAGAKILGVVLNGVDLSSNRYYGHYYGKYYGSYYGNYGKKSSSEGSGNR